MYTMRKKVSEQVSKEIHLTHFIVIKIHEKKMLNELRTFLSVSED